MKPNAVARKLLVLCTVFLTAFPAVVQACGLKLVLAMDVSASISAREYNLQRAGLANAFRDSAIIDAILSLDGGLLVSVTQWAGADDQDWSLGWVHVQTSRDALAFANQLDGLSDPFPPSPTAVGSALRHASDVLAKAPLSCRRTVIDVSSDGATNTGLDTRGEADALGKRSVTINALLILIKSKHQYDADRFEEDLIGWYTRTVVRGPGAFVMTTPTYDSFPEAIRKKLLREIRPQFAMHTR